MKPQLRIVIPGGSGQVGQILARHFHDRKHEVTVVARHAEKKPWKTVLWDVHELGAWASELDGADVVINLAGRSVNCRYSPSNRREIKESRVRATRLVAEAIRRASKPPVLWMNASTATIYRHSFDRAMDEDTGELGGNEPGAPATWNFSIDVARSWEEAFFESPSLRTRKVALRSAMVMSPDQGGVFDMLLRLVRYGLGGAAGSGRQYVSWVHDIDFISAVDFLIARPDMDGVINISSPRPLPNDEFMRLLRQAWGRTIGLRAAKWMLEIGAAVLRTETELVLKSRRVEPARLTGFGFTFRFPSWGEASHDLVNRWRDRRNGITPQT